MSRKQKHPRKSSRRGTYSGTSRWSTPIFDDAIRDKDAYRTLLPAQKLVLFDMMRVYYRASCWDTENISDTGFTYSYAQCREDLSAHAFYDALKVIVARGWFSIAYDLQEIKAGAPKKYLPSRDWEKYQATKEERMRLHDRKTRKEQRIQRDRQSLADLRTHSLQKETESGTTEVLYTVQQKCSSTSGVFANGTTEV